MQTSPPHCEWQINPNPNMQSGGQTGYIQESKNSTYYHAAVYQILFKSATQ